MNMGLSERHLPRLAPLVLLALVAGLLFPLVPASAQDEDKDPCETEIQVSIDIGEAREPGSITMTFKPLKSKDPPQDPPSACTDDRYVYLALSGTAQERKEDDYTVTGSNGKPLPTPVVDTLYSHKVTLKAADDSSATTRFKVRNDNEAEQCEVIKVEAIERRGEGADDWEGVPIQLGITLLYIPANDLDRPHMTVLPSVSVPSLYPRVGVTLTATLDDRSLEDPSGAENGTKWDWHRSTRLDRDWELIDSFTNSYTPKAEDVGYYLRPTAVYDTDRHDVACAQVVSLGRVANGRGDGANTAPEFDSTSVDRQVSKDAPMDSRVGDPVTATDDDNDPLTYSLEDNNDDPFRIDPKTGQIKTYREPPLDSKVHSVTVRATDPMMGSDTVDVNIDVTDDPPPPITSTSTSTSTSGNSNSNSNSNSGNSNGGTSGGNSNGGGTKSTDTSDFSDLDSAGEHKGPMQTLDSEDVLDGTGCDDGLLCPGGPLLRWEAAVWLVRVLDGKNPDPVTTVRFTDVDATAWWAPYVERLAELGVTVGCKEDPDIYCPDIEIPRAQMASFLARAFDLPAVEHVGFTDVRGPVHSANIDSAYTAGVMESCSVDPLKFCTRQSTTRGEFATYLIRGRTYASG